MVIAMNSNTVTFQEMGGTSVSSSQRTMRPGGYEPRLYGETEQLLQHDPNVQTLIAIVDDFIQRLLRLDPAALSELKAAYIAGDEDKMAEILGYTDSELQEIDYKIQEASDAILSTYPEIRNMIADEEAPCNGIDCSQAFERFLDNLDEVRRNPSTLREEKCQVVALVACLLICRDIAPSVGYLTCGVVCVCSFCEGGWIDILCNPVVW